ncbi:MAG: hypothetical protein ACLGXA_16470 [Acidobacteriota bacterium]
MLTKIRFTALLGIGCAVAFTAPAARAQTTSADCRYLVAGHSYANVFGGYINAKKYRDLNLPVELGVVPNAGAGVVTFLPGGVVKMTETLVIGQVGALTGGLTGTYSLKFDTSKTPLLCAGTISATLNGTGVNGVPAITDNFQITVTPEGSRVEMIHTNPGLIVQTVARPAETHGCRNGTIGGSYTYSTTGWALAALDPSIQPTDGVQQCGGYITAAMTGGMQFFPGFPPAAGFDDVPEGASAMTGWDTLNANGGLPSPANPSVYVPIVRKMWGWYKVNRQDCSGTMVVRDDTGVDPDFYINFYIGEDGRAIYAVNVNTFELPGLPVPVPLFVMPISMERVNFSGPR